MIDTTTDLTTEAVVRDSWDRQDYDAALADIPMLGESVARLAEAHPLGADAMADLWAAFLKGAPKRPPASAMRPSHMVNHALAGAALDSDELRDLRRFTVGNPVSTAMACIAYTRAAADLYGQLGEVSEQAKAAQGAADALNDFLGEHEPDAIESDADLAAALEALSDQADQAASELADAVDDASVVMGHVVRTGLAEAAEAAEETAEAMTAMGIAPGDVARMNGAERLRLATRLADQQRFRRIAEKMGFLHNMARSERTARTNSIPEERHDVTYGNDLGRVLMGEMIGLAVPALEFDFYDRFTRKRLLQHDVRGNDTGGKGAIVFVGDFSLSMYHPDPNKAEFCKAMGGALLRVARDEGRSFWAIDFAGPGQVAVFDFSDPDAVDPNAILDYFEHGFTNGGTCFVTALDAAVAVLEAEHAATGKVSADICFSTDGEAYVPPAWMEKFKATQARLGFFVYGIAIGGSVDDEPFATICDRRAETLKDLVTGKNVQRMFRSIS